jgi:hypothetical protein
MGYFAGAATTVDDDESFEYWLHYGRIILNVYKTGTSGQLLQGRLKRRLL